MPERIQLQRKKGWRKPAGAVSVVRPTIWGNPWFVGVPGIVLLDGCTYRLPIQISQGGAVLVYRRWLAGDEMLPVLLPSSLTEAGRRNVMTYLADRRETILSRLPQLRGKNLACWCKDGPCHADVLLELANAEAGE